MGLQSRSPGRRGGGGTISAGRSFWALEAYIRGELIFGIQFTLNLSMNSLASDEQVENEMELQKAGTKPNKY